MNNMAEVRTGTIVYTERAFEQDADLAMGADIVRALIELITNADDAYGDGDGEIAVEVARGADAAVVVRVRDAAKGLSPDELEQCFGVLGGETSGFREGRRVRGLFGRGAKDTAAFGKTIFETIKAGVFGRFELDRSGAWSLESHSVTAEERERLKLPGDSAGLQASIVVLRAGVSIPPPGILAERLARHVQLREITQRRVLTLAVEAPGRRSSTMVLRWDEPRGDLVLDQELTIAGYESQAQLTIWRMDTPSPDRLDACSAQGVVVRSSRAAFSNTFFGESSPETAWIHGILDCPMIDQLILEYDQHRGADPSNPSRLLRRDREGLVSDHPFTVALTSAVLDQLAPLLEAMRPTREARGGGERLRDDLSRAGLAIAALLRADLQRIEADEAPGGLRPTTASPIIVIPPRVAIRQGMARSLTVLLDDNVLTFDSEIRAVSYDDRVLKVTSVTERVPHASFPGVSVLNVRLSALEVGQLTVAVIHGESRLSASSEIRIHNDEVDPPGPPEDLEWANSTMSVTVGKTRSLLLRAPVELAPSGELSCRIELSGDGAELSMPTALLRVTRDGWLEGRCQVRGSVVNTTSQLVATAVGRVAEGSLRVSRPTALSGSNVEVDIVDELQGHVRAAIRESDTGYLVQVYAKHPALQPVLGSLTESGEFENEHEAPARIGISEAAATAIADWLVRSEASRMPHLYADAEAVLSERSKIVARYLIPLLRALSGGAA